MSNFDKQKNVVTTLVDMGYIKEESEYLAKESRGELDKAFEIMFSAEYSSSDKKKEFEGVKKGKSKESKGSKNSHMRSVTFVNTVSHQLERTKKPSSPQTSSKRLLAWKKFLMGKKTRSKKELKTCVKLFTEISDGKGIANSLKNIGAIYYREKQLVKAIRYYKKSLGTSYLSEGTTKNVVLERSVVNYTVHLLLDKLGRKGEAEEYFSRIEDKSFLIKFLKTAKKGDVKDKKTLNQEIKKDKESMNKREVVVVMHRYERREDDEIDISPGQRIEVLRKNEDGYWLGKILGTNRKGMFPSNFSKPYEEVEEKVVNKEEEDEGHLTQSMRVDEGEKMLFRKIKKKKDVKEKEVEEEEHDDNHLSESMRLGNGEKMLFKKRFQKLKEESSGDEEEETTEDSGEEGKSLSIPLGELGDEIDGGLSPKRKHGKTASFYEKNKDFTIKDDDVFLMAKQEMGVTDNRTFRAGKTKLHNKDADFEFSDSDEDEEFKGIINARKEETETNEDIIERKKKYIEKRQRQFTAKNYLKLVKVMDEIVVLSPENPEILQMKSRLMNNLGSIYFKTKSYVKAKSVFKKTIKLKKQCKDKNTFIPYNNIGKIYYIQTNYSKAVKYFHKALKTNKSNLKLLDNIVLVYFQMKKYQKCLNYLTRVVRFEKNQNKMFLNYKKFGYCHYRLREYKKSLKYYRKAQKINRNDKSLNLNVERLTKLNDL